MSASRLPPPPQTVSTASELRKPIYWIVAARAIDYEQMLLLMAGVKWDIREIMSQHNVYVDVLLKVIQRGGVTLTAVGEDVCLRRLLLAAPKSHHFIQVHINDESSMVGI